MDAGPPLNVVPPSTELLCVRWRKMQHMYGAKHARHKRAVATMYTASSAMYVDHQPWNTPALEHTHARCKLEVGRGGGIGGNAGAQA